MATITLKRKDGKITAYKFRAYLGRDEGGKRFLQRIQIYRENIQRSLLFFCRTFIKES